MYWILLEEEAELELRYLHEFYSSSGTDLARRFKQALTDNFSTLETFPLAFPVVDETFGIPIRRVLIRGFPKALLYLVIEESSEVRILRCYDTRSAESKPRKT